MNNFEESSSPFGLANFFSETPTSSSVTLPSPPTENALTTPLTPMAATPKPFNAEKITETWRLPQPPGNLHPFGTPTQPLQNTLPSPGYGPAYTPSTPLRGHNSPIPQATPQPTPQVTPQVTSQTTPQTTLLATSQPTLQTTPQPTLQPTSQAILQPMSVSPVQIKLPSIATAQPKSPVSISSISPDYAPRDTSDLPKVTIPNITLPTSPRQPKTTSFNMKSTTVPSQPRIQPTPGSTRSSSEVFPSVTLPKTTSSMTDLSEIDTLGTFIPSVLADNETGDLRWDRPDRPRPKSPNSSYRRVGCIADGSCFFHAISKGLSSVYQASYREPTKTVTEDILNKLETAVNRSIIFPSHLFTEPRCADPQAIYTIKLNMYKAYINLMNRFRFEYIKILRKDFANKIMTESRMHDIIKNRFKGRINLEYAIIVSQANEERIKQGYDSLEVTPKVNRLKDSTQDTFVMNRALQTVKEQLAQELLSGDAVQPDFMLILSDYVGVDIYLLRDKDLCDPNPKNTPLYGGTSTHAAVHGPKDMRSTDDVNKGLPDRRAIVLIAIDDFHYEVVARVDAFRENNYYKKYQNQTNIGFDYYIHPNMDEEEPLIRKLYKMLRVRRASDSV